MNFRAGSENWISDYGDFTDEQRLHTVTVGHNGYSFDDVVAENLERGVALRTRHLISVRFAQRLVDLSKCWEA